jgi:hypothetical protein
MLTLQTQVCISPQLFFLVGELVLRIYIKVIKFMLYPKINSTIRNFGIMSQGNTILKQRECFQAIWIRKWEYALMI